MSDDSTTPVTIRVIGKRGTLVRTLRETVTTIPRDRLATLRMPIQWLCDGSAKSAGGADITSTCDEGLTCQAGACVPKDLVQDELPTYVPADVFGGGNEQGSGTCFDTVPCMIGGTIAKPDANCTIPRPPGAGDVNVALRVPSGGICDDAETNCFVPLDRNGRDGFVDPGSNGGPILLPKAACTRLAEGRVTGIIVSTTCATKTETTPTCGPWSSVNGASTRPPGDAGAAGPALVATVPAALKINDGAVCCPLMVNAATLHTCVCRPGMKSMQLVAVNPSSGQVTTIGTAPLLTTRTAIPAALADGAVFFIDCDTSGSSVRSRLKRMSVTDGVITELGVAEDANDATSLLVDDTSVYSLTSRVIPSDAGAGAAAFSIIKFDKTAPTSKSFPLDRASAVLQFAQDDAALYVGGITEANAGAKIARTSTLFRLSKESGAKKLANEWASRRVAFGAPIRRHQAIEFMLADMAVEIMAAKSMIYRVAWQIDQNIDRKVAHAPGQRDQAPRVRNGRSRARQGGADLRRARLHA